MVPLLDRAADLVKQADHLAIIGTSLVVYPAAGLINYAPVDCPIYIIDPNMPVVAETDNLIKIEQPATIGTQKLYDLLVKDK